MKNVLFVINSLQLGGAEQSLVSLLNVMDFREYAVDLMMFIPGGCLEKRLPAQVHILPPPDFLKCGGSVKARLRRPKYLLAAAAASVGLRCPTGLHPAQCYWKYAGFAFDPLPCRYDAAVAWGQGNPTHYVAGKVRAERKIAFVNADYRAVGHSRAFDLPYYEKFDFIACVSDALRTEMAGLFPERVEKIVTVHDISNAGRIVKMASARDPFAGEDSGLKLVTVGRLAAQKGYDLAVEAAELLKRRGIRFKWFFVGEGPERAGIEEQIARAGLENRVILTGATENPYVYMKHADIYVQTSRSEGYCLAVAEARILNTPVVSTDFTAVHNQLRDGENGLIAGMNAAAVADAILRLQSTPGLRAHIVETLKEEKKGNQEEIRRLYSLLG